MSAAPLVYITGASSGIGLALAQTYAQRGWRLALVARREAPMRDWAAAAGLSTDQVWITTADVSRIDDIVAAGERCLQVMGLPEVVIANAGFSVGVDTAERADLRVIAELHATHSVGTPATFHPFVAPMRAAGRGRLVAVASVGAIRGMPGHGGYCASKAAVLSYAESLRIELRGSGVRVVTLLPGFVDTPLTAGNPYPMPFRISAPVFAERAIAAIATGVSRRVIPWPMAWVARLLRLLPDALFDRAFAGRARKPRRRAD